MNKINRRSFLKTSAAASALAVNFVPSRVFGANDRVRIGVAGINGRGQSHMGAYLGMTLTAGSLKAVPAPLKANRVNAPSVFRMFVRHWRTRIWMRYP